MTKRADFIATVAGTTTAVAVAPSLGATPTDVAGATRGMTLTMLRDGNVDRLGIRTKRGIVDVARAATALLLADAPASIDDVVQGRGDPTILRRIADEAPRDALQPEATAQHGPLVSRPQKIVCVGLNYRSHIAEIGEKTPPYPDLFNKYNTALNRHGGTIAVSHMPFSHFDYETELTFVIGRRASNVSEADALQYVYGYTIGHDFTARDAQFRVTQWMTGKTPDQFAPIGPWLVTADQIADPQSLRLQTFVNDETVPRQDAMTAQMIFSVAKIVSYTSSFVTLEPGDVVFTGTPSGVITGYPKDKQVWLKPGDRVRSTISKLGELKFSLV